jgi:hypothetical protein
VRMRSTTSVRGSTSTLFSTPLISNVTFMRSLPARD